MENKPVTPDKPTCSGSVYKPRHTENVCWLIGIQCWYRFDVGWSVGSSAVAVCRQAGGDAISHIHTMAAHASLCGQPDKYGPGSISLQMISSKLKVLKYWAVADFSGVVVSSKYTDHFVITNAKQQSKKKKQVISKRDRCASQIKNIFHAFLCA